MRAVRHGHDRTSGTAKIPWHGRSVVVPLGFGSRGDGGRGTPVPYAFQESSVTVVALSYPVCWRFRDWCQRTIVPRACSLIRSTHGVRPRTG